MDAASHQTGFVRLTAGPTGRTRAETHGLGFWKALREVYGTTREQRCWVHKTANVLNKLPKSVQPRAKQRCRRWLACGCWG